MQNWQTPRSVSWRWLINAVPAPAGWQVEVGHSDAVYLYPLAVGMDWTSGGSLSSFFSDFMRFEANFGFKRR